MKKLFTLLFLCLTLATARSQGWERYYPELTSLDLLYGLVPTPDGGFLMSADKEYWGVSPHLFLKIHPGGSPDTLFEQSTVLSAFQPSMLPLDNGHLLFCTFSSATSGTILTETDANLQTVWTVSYPGIYLGNYTSPHLIATEGGYLTAYQAGEYGLIHVTKINLNGVVLWQKSYNFDTYGASIRSFLDIASDSQGNFYITGVQDFPYAPVLGKFTSDGSFVYANVYTQPGLIYGFGSLALQNDNLMAAAATNNIALINPQNGAVTGTIALGSAAGLRRSSDGKLLVFVNSSGDGNFYISKREWNGTVIWQKVIDRPESLEGAYDFWPMPDGGAAGIGRGFTGSGYTPLVFRVDGSGNTFTNLIQGNVFTDLDHDCVFSPGLDTTHAGFIVTAQQDEDTYYATTDAEGNYSINIGSGEFLMRVKPPSAFWEICDDSVTVSLNGAFDTVGFNSAVSALGCPSLSIDLSAAFLRRCFESTYLISYTNDGSATAEAAVANLILDPLLEFQGASIPFTDLGDNAYSFAVGDVGPLETYTFSVTVLVNCDAELGQTHCSSASIEFANPCPSTPVAFPVITVEADCQTDSVAFTIKNIGDAPMVNPAEFVVIEDLIVMREGQFQLPNQQQTVITCPADGSTYRMYAGQAPGESPFFSPTAAIEGCNGVVQPGFWNMFPEFVDTDGADRDCQANIGAFDPNDKQAVPVGYADQHLIERNIPLTYTIRFQNTGTDTAFNVVVRDTLSSFLNAPSIRSISASHAFKWQLTGNGVLEFRFDDILLPDSTTNLEGSQGFVKFTIDQQPDLPLETLIENSAAIYFDFNAPVITNTVWHRIGTQFVPGLDTWEPARPGVLLRVFPNPVSDMAWIDLSGWTGGSDLTLRLFNAQGQLVRTISGDSLGFVLQRGDLTSGIYTFVVETPGGLVGRGKLVL